MRDIIRCDGQFIDNYYTSAYAKPTLETQSWLLLYNTQNQLGFFSAQAVPEKTKQAPAPQKEHSYL